MVTPNPDQVSFKKPIPFHLFLTVTVRKVGLKLIS